ncbi:DUF2095 family protein [Candidatus Bathyarchaeota archaeon]|nr:DUF2095 family protein [Candidatus Bathyarchaeota archaeon]
MYIDKESFKRMFPNLYREIENKTQTVKIDGVRLNADEEKDEGDVLRGFIPGAVDYIRRCDKVEEAEEIILYLKSRGEIEEEYADKLLKQLKEKGLRSFGPKKEDGYYFKIAGLK